MVANSRDRKWQSIVKPASQGGRYITLTPDAPTFEAKNLFALLNYFVFQPMLRSLWYNKYNILTRNKLPSFYKADGLPESRDIITRTLRLAQEQKLKGVVEGPYPMTTDGVRKAFKSLQIQHCKVKVVIKVADL